jgi:streptomycin 6-kinase
MVRAFEIDDGAALLERATPGASLVDIAAVDDDRATSIIAAVIREFSPLEPPPGTRTVEDWGRSFEQYHISGDRQVAPNLVLRARASYDALCTSQTDRRLLHGDLQHSNILMDRDRGWLAIDPKGLIGEPECEVGPFLRNPPHLPHLFNRLETVERRLRILCNEAALRYDRAIGWAFALAVLSAIWGVEDDGVVYDDSPALTLARALLPAIESAPKSG